MSNIDDIAIRVSGVTKTFKLPHEKHNSIKSLFVNMFRSNRTYEKQLVLNDITFEIKKGQFFGIVGRNGSGKSTLLKLLAGIYTPDKGHIRVSGKLTPFIELGVGFNPELTGRENVFLNGALLGFNRKAMEAMYDEIVAFAELEKFMDQKLKNYSSGMQVRLAFSIAIRANTEILILDEVLAVGDAAFQQKCFDYFEELKNSGKTVVLVTHDMGAVRRFCTSAIYIKNGKLIHEGDVEEVADIYVEENLQKSVVHEEEGVESGVEIRTKIIKKDKYIEIEISYSSKDEDNKYVGISIQRDGFSIAEINSKHQKPLSKKGKIQYSLDSSVLNAGTYRIGAALFKYRNNGLLAISKEKGEFILKGAEETRGGALKLEDTWRI